MVADRAAVADVHALHLLRGFVYIMMSAYLSVPKPAAFMHAMGNPVMLPMQQPVAVDDDALWATLRRARNLFPLPQGLTRIAVPTLINAVSGRTRELSREEFIEHAYAEATGRIVPAVRYKQLNRAMDKWRAVLAGRLQHAKLLPGDFEKARCLGFDWPCLRFGVGQTASAGLVVAEARSVEEVWNEKLRWQYAQAMQDVLSLNSQRSGHLVFLLLCRILCGSQDVVTALVHALGPLELWHYISASIREDPGSVFLPSLLTALNDLNWTAAGTVEFTFDLSPFYELDPASLT